VDRVQAPFSGALIRRATGQVTAELRCGAVALDPRAAKVTVNGAELRLPGC
jgi:hypothetical protein